MVIGSLPHRLVSPKSAAANARVPCDHVGFFGSQRVVAEAAFMPFLLALYVHVSTHRIDSGAWEGCVTAIWHFAPSVTLDGFGYAAVT